MALQIDISKNKILGPAYRNAKKAGVRRILRIQMKKRFGSIPAWANKRLTSKSAKQLNDVADRVFDAVSLEELLQ